MTALALFGNRVSRLRAACGRLEALMTVFALLSVLDFVLTWLLIRTPKSSIIEANPLAGWVLHHYGWLGLAFYKGVLVIVVLALCLVIGRRRPGTGRFVCVVGCNSLAIVVCYSLTLLVVFPEGAWAGHAKAYEQHIEQSVAAP